MILIIDDDAAVRSSLTFLLKRAGFEPEAVPGPEEALVVVRQTTLQLILMDMNFTLSPVIRTEAFVGANRETVPSTSINGALWPMILSK